MDYLNLLRQRLTALLDQRAAAKAELDTMLDAVAVEQRSALTEAEEAKFAELRERLASLKAECEPIEARIGEIEAEIAAADQAAEAVKRYQPVERPAYDTPARVTSEPATYRADGPASFFTDLAFRSMDPTAPERLARHANEMRGVERRDGNTGNYAGLVVPQYLTDLVAPLIRAGRPFANAVNTAPLPPVGMTVNISRITTGSSTTLQSSENSALAEVDIDDTLLTASVRTLGGIQDISRQALERGIGVDQVIINDLAAAYAAAVDSHLINHGTDGVLATSGINAVTYTDASPTVPELFPKLADAIQQINTNRLLPADLIVMHPRRWGWITAALDSQNRPLVVPTGVPHIGPVSVGNAAAVQTVVGSLLGLPVITDPNVPTNLGAGTNEDRIIVTRSSDLYLWEEPGSPLRVRVDEPGANALTCRYVLWGYFAFTAARYAAATSVISGTGLVTPTF